eukprot:RCo053356
MSDAVVPRVTAPADILFHCPLGHNLSFRVRSPYIGGAVCDRCDCPLDAYTCSKGFYHCVVERCRASSPAYGWDICADCALRDVLIRQSFQEEEDPLFAMAQRLLALNQWGGRGQSPVQGDAVPSSSGSV